MVCRDLCFSRPVVIENRSFIKLKAQKKEMKNSTATISNNEICTTSKKFYSRNLLCAFGILSPACRKKKAGSLKMCAADCSELLKQLLL